MTRKLSPKVGKFLKTKKCLRGRNKRLGRELDCKVWFCCADVIQADVVQAEVIQSVAVT